MFNKDSIFVKDGILGKEQKMSLTGNKTRIAVNKKTTVSHRLLPASLSLLPTFVNLLPASLSLRPTFASLQPTCLSLRPASHSLRCLLSPASNFSRYIIKILIQYYKILTKNDKMSLILNNTFSNDYIYHRKDNLSLISANIESYTEELSLTKTLNILTTSVICYRLQTLSRLMQTKNLPILNPSPNKGGKPENQNNQQ